MDISINDTSTSPNATARNPPLGRHPRQLPLARPAVFVARITPAGNVAWLRTVPSAGSDSVSAILLHADHVFVVGTSTAAISGANRTTAEGTPSVFVAKMTMLGRDAWGKPLMFGSGGVDSVSAVAVDSTRYFPHLYVSGSVGGQAFPTAKRDELDAHAQDGGGADEVITTARAEGNESAVDVQVEMGEEWRQRRRSRLRGVESDLFVAKIDPRSGNLEAAVQLPLDGDNSADALALHDGVVYAAVNSYDAARFDPTGSTALYAFRADDLAYHAVHLPAAYNRPGEYVQSMAGDRAGNLYLAGFALRGHQMEDGKFVLRKYVAGDGVVEWEKTLGNHTKVEPRLSVAVGRTSGNVFVSGHTAGVYQNHDGHGGELLCLPLTVFSPDGRKLMSWDRTSPYPAGYEEISALTLDKDENVVYAGKWLDPSDELYDATVGSFGASSYTARVANDGASAPVSISSTAGGMATSTIGLICLAVGFAIVLIGAATTMGRAKMLGDKGLVYGAADDSVGDDMDGTLDYMDARTVLASQPGSDDVRLMLSSGSRIQMQAGGSSAPV